jgi:hypothetical protein
LGADGHETVHGGVGIDEAVGGTEGGAEDVIGAELRESRGDLVVGEHDGVGEAEFPLAVLVGAKVAEMGLGGGEEKVALGTIAGGLAEAFVERGVEGDGVERHANVDFGGELRTHATHALSGGTLALVGFSFDDEDVVASGLSEVISDA